MVIVELQDGRVYHYRSATRFERHSAQTIIYEEKTKKRKEKRIRYKNGKPYVAWETAEHKTTKVVSRYQSGLLRIEYAGVSKLVKGPKPQPPQIVK